MSEQRDLKADLREWNSDLINGIRSTDWFYLAGEYIERAIDAEETLESLLDDYTMILLNVPGAATADGIVDYIERIRIENAALREENDLQRHSIQQLSAQVAAQVAGLREALSVIRNNPDLWKRPKIGGQDKYAGMPPLVRKIDSILSQPDPGAEIMERMKKLEAVVEAARGIKEYLSNSDNCKCAWCGISKTLRQALAALEGPAHE